MAVSAPESTSTPQSSPTNLSPARTLHDVVFVEGVRTPFGKAGDKGQYAQTRADDLVVKVIRELLRRQPGLPPERIDEVAIAAATQTGDQGLTIGRTSAILAGLPKSVPGFAIDRMCAGAMTAVTTVASGIAVGAYDVAIAGGVEHMGHHPMAQGADPNPRFLADRLVDPSALNMGSTAENMHDRYPHLTRQRADAFAVASQDKYAKALADGATGCLLVAADVAAELGLPIRMRMVSYAFAGVEPETMGVGPIPATQKALAKAGLRIEDIGLIEINEAFAVQVLTFTDHFGLSDDDPRINQYGGAIAVGHPLASSGVRLMTQLARQFAERPDVRYGLTTMCVGLGMGGTVIWENPNYLAADSADTAASDIATADNASSDTATSDPATSDKTVADTAGSSL